MLARIALLVITVFWLTMNYLLWRSEFGRGNHEGTSVPAAVVWKKILSSPDTSNLEIRHKGKKVGDCTLSSKISEELSTGTVDATGLPTQDSKSKTSSYQIHLDGGIALESGTPRLRFDFQLKMNTNQSWQEFTARASLRPAIWELRALASEQAIHLRSDDDNGKVERVIKLDDLQHPETFLSELDVPPSLQILGLSGILSGGAQGRAYISLGLKWEANDEWYEFGHTSIRAYRIRAKLLDRYGIVIVVNRVGEVLRVELPDDWVLSADPLNNS